MKIFLKLLIALLISDNVSAQNTFPIKEHYDKLYSSVYAPANFDYNYCFATGNSLSWTLSGLLRMYETTGDKAYLVKFINHCIQLQKIRKDESGTEAVAAWVGQNDNYCYPNNANGGTEPAYFNSLLIYPMAEFVNMVINEPGHNLYNTNLPIQPGTTQNIVDISTLNSMNPGFQILGYGDFANWLGKRVEETMMYMNNNYWNNSFGIKGHFSDGGAIHGSAMNMNSPYGCALLYMGLANTNFGYGNNRANYLYKAQFIASYYKGNMNLTDHCNAPSCAPIYQNNPVLWPMINNSFLWYHAGWSYQTRNCDPPCTYQDQPKINEYVKNIEDVSHGAMDLWFAKACYDAQLAPDNLSPPYFDEIVMERFRNTFTKNVYFTNGTGAHFHNCVNGSDNQFTGNSCSPSCPSDLFYGEALAWMPMYNYDGNSLPNVYDILIQHTTGLISPTSPPSVQNLTGAQSFQGLSEVVKAQWDKECINLTLYNRDVVYNQDFIVKNKLMIAPEQVDGFHQLNSNSFADPITTNNIFQIKAGKSVNMVAGESIQLLPGFVATAGSNFRASINQSACTDGRMYTANQNNDKGNLSSSLPMDVSTKTFGQQAKIKNKVTTSATRTNNISIFPNPNNGTFKITVTENNKPIAIKELKVYDLMGKVIWQTGASSYNEFDVDITNYAQGIYYVRSVNDASEIEVQKLIKK